MQKGLRTSHPTVLKNCTRLTVGDKMGTLSSSPVAIYQTYKNNCAKQQTQCMALIIKHNGTMAHEHTDQTHTETVLKDENHICHSLSQLKSTTQCLRVLQKKEVVKHNSYCSVFLHWLAELRVQYTLPCTRLYICVLVTLMYFCSVFDFLFELAGCWRRMCL